MIRRIVIALLLIGWTVTSASAADIVTFKGPTATGDLLPLTAKLTKPKGGGPFAAVVLLHGCGGITARDDMWAERLASWNYVALQVESLRSEGNSNVGDEPHHPRAWKHALDAFSAKSYLAGLDFVDGNRIALMGWEHGGLSTLYAVSPWVQAQGDPFRAAIAVYPYCSISLKNLNIVC